MKKFYTKLSRPQWRVTVPTINTSIFGKTFSTSTEDKSTCSLEEKCDFRNSGSYDLVHEDEDKKENRQHSEYINIPKDKKDEVSDESDMESKYEDASPMYEKQIEFDEDEEQNIYADVENIRPVSTEIPSSESSASYEYDVPRISFHFFEEGLKDFIDDKNAQQKRKSEIRIVLQQPSVIEEEDEEEMKNNEEEEIKTDTEDFKMRSVEIDGNLEVETNLEVRDEDFEVIDLEETDESNEKTDESISQSDVSISATRCEIDEPKVVEMNISLDNLSLGKLSRCYSDTSVDVRLKEIEEEENIYKVPRSHKRLSQSLDNIQTVTKLDVPIEEVPRNNIIIEHNIVLKKQQESDETQSSFEYCDVRSKLPLKIRRATLLRTPHVRSKAADTWFNLRSKVSNIITTHSAAQRVGANASGDKLVNLEEFYRNSRTKCKRIVQNTSKIFNKKRGQENVDPNGDTSSQIVKNDAFFAKVNENGCSEVDSGSDRFGGSKLLEEDRVMSEFDFSTLKSAFRRSRLIAEGQNGFDDLRRFVKQGGDFCKELSAILQERSEAELQYAKSLSKLSQKLQRACREGVGGLNEAWKSVASDMETRSEIHRQFSTSLCEEIVKPLKVLTDHQHKTRKLAEGTVDKTARSLADWRAAEAKSKKQSHVCARDNEKLQDALLDVRLSRSTSLIQLAHMHNHKALSDKESAKLEGKKRKAEDAVKKADIEYYTLCVRAERARLEWESAVLRGSNTFQTLEEERLKNLKSVLNSYLQHSNEMCPKLIESNEKLKVPIDEAEPGKDLSAFINLRNSSQHVSEQLLPDFYCEHITLAMNRERRKQALIKLLHLIRQDLERERKSKNGLENLSRAIKQTPNFGSEDSQQNVCEKLYHMRSMLTYLEGARYKVQSALAELESKQRTSHPLAAHITITRDKSGLQQSVLKVPQWLKEEFICEDSSLDKTSLEKTDVGENDLDWNDDRGMADGNSNQHDSDFDEFSSQESGSVVEECNNIPLGQCKALYVYTANLHDEINLTPGDVLSIYRKQEDGWWLGECNGCVGIFPATYVETI